MNNYEKIKSMSIDELAEYIRSECLTSCIKGVVLDKESIKQWLLAECEKD